MFEWIKECLDGKEFKTVEDYNVEILGITSNLREELNKAERFYLSEEGRKEFFNE